MHKVTLIPGDGIGPEIVEAVQKIFEAAGAPIEWETENAGQTTYDEKGELLPQSLLESIKRNKVALKGPITTPVGEGFKSVNVQLRQEFDLYCNLRPAKTSPGVKTRFDNVDIVTFRENTEGLYSGLEYYDSRLEISDSIARVSRMGCERIVKSAFVYAREHGRKKVTVVHKANILKNAGSILLKAADKIAAQYPEIELQSMIIDNTCMQLVSRPEQFDVIVTTNLFGDILSDLCAGLVGGLGVVSGANIGAEIAVFEAVHGSAPDIAGKGVANPTALLRSAIMMLEYLNEREIASKIDMALEKTLVDKSSCTADLGGAANTRVFTQKIIDNIAKVESLTV